MPETLRLFAAGGGGSSATEVRACPQCGRAFTSAGSFCPYDGVGLAAIPGNAGVRDEAGLVGAVVDRRYEVLGVLGHGGMGTVYLVRHVALSRDLALKVLRGELAREPEVAARFTREAKAAAAIEHPSVVVITDFGTLASGAPYFVMEFVPGVTLAELLRLEPRLAPARVLRVARQIADGLAAAHLAGIVHRDLKPDNVIVGPRDVTKLLDFGLARVAGASRLTRAGIVFGTPHYMSPEQAAGEASDHRVDIYALGVLIYRTLAGRVPFEADTYLGVMELHLRATPAPLSVPTADALEATLATVAMRCMEKAPSDRFASMNELIAELDRIARLARTLSSPPPASVMPRPPPPARGTPPPSRRRHVRTTAFAVVGGALALGTLGLVVGLSLSRGGHGAAQAPSSGTAPPSESSGPAGTFGAPDGRRGVGETTSERASALASSGATGSVSATPSGSGGGPTTKKRGSRPASPGVGDIVDPWEN